MEKRGQVYILAALVLIFVLFILISQSNVIRELVLENDFEKLTKNYEDESSRFVNSLLVTEEDISEKFLEFTIYFTSYSKTQNPDFGLIYIFDYNEKLHVGNYLNETIIVHGNEIEGCFDKISTSVSLGGLSLNIPLDFKTISNCDLTIGSLGSNYLLPIKIGEFTYEADVTAGRPEVMIVTREAKEGQRKVFIGKGFKKGKVK